MQERSAFRGRLDHFLHPSKHIESPEQLYGRESALLEMLDAFETPGTHPFIWGVRGIGKTSLAHTACYHYGRQVEFAAAISCSRDLPFRNMIDDLVADALERKKSFYKDKKLRASLSAFGITLSTEIEGMQSDSSTLSVNQAANLLDNFFSLDRYSAKIPVIIVDEFDRLEATDTLQAISDLLKQLSVINASVKICFCGITEDLGYLLSSHQSVERYIFGVELRPISFDSIWKLIRRIGAEFDVEFDRGQEVRISQIAAGYPHFAHLIMKNTLLGMFEAQEEGQIVSNDDFKEGLNRSAKQAATSLKTAYESAIRKGTDRYIEVLFAVANSEHMNRQFKEVLSDYEKIMKTRKHREGYDTAKNNGQDLRNALNNLASRGTLRKGKTGWYQFSDPMLRSYVRLIAETEGIQLSDEAFGA